MEGGGGGTGVQSLQSRIRLLRALGGFQKMLTHFSPSPEVYVYVVAS